MGPLISPHSSMARFIIPVPPTPTFSGPKHRTVYEQWLYNGYRMDIEVSKKGYRRDIEIYFYFSATILMISSETTCQKAFAQNKATEVPVPFLP